MYESNILTTLFILFNVFYLSGFIVSWWMEWDDNLNYICYWNKRVLGHLNNVNNDLAIQMANKYSWFSWFNVIYILSERVGHELQNTK